MFLEICMQIHSLFFALSSQINKQKYAKTMNLLCADNKVFVKYQAQGKGGCIHPTPLRTPLALIINENISAPSWDIGGKYTQRYDTTVHNCKTIRMSVQTGE